MREDTDKDLVDNLKNGDMASFEKLYKKYYIYLCLVAERIVKEPLDAEEIASDVFVRLWLMRDKIGDIKSIKAYLIKSTKNSSLNHLRHLQVTVNGYLDNNSDFDENLAIWSDDYPMGRLFEEDAVRIISKGISELPESCRNIFLLSRDHNKKYEDIASQLGISINTVKAQMKIALRRIRALLEDFM